MNLSNEKTRRNSLNLIGQYDVPAYILRGIKVEESEKQLMARCRAQRTKLLEISKMRLAVVGALINFQWSTLSSFFPDEKTSDYLLKLHQKWAPKLRSPVKSTNSSRKIRQALIEMVDSFTRFNQKWEKIIMELDLGPINELREGYNKYYLVEKTCAFQSDEIAREGFEEILPFTLPEILLQLPYLKVPTIL